MQLPLREKGFTLIELLVVIAIIGILASVVLASLSSARVKGADASTKSQLASMRAEAEIFLSTTGSYAGVCLSAKVSQMLDGAYDSSGATAEQFSSGGSPPSQVGALTQITCHDTNGAGSAWVADAPMKGGGMWCVDSTGASKPEATFMTAAATACAP